MRKSFFLAISGASMPLLNACVAEPSGKYLKNLGLKPADENGVCLPIGSDLKSRIVARTGQVTGNQGYVWHGAPDGGACFATEDGGWIYVSNAELGNGKGGVGALRFSNSGEVLDAYPILRGSSRNCAGGKMPWGTWMSCEESGDQGRVFECDPTGVEPAKEIPMLGRFNHEAVAYDTEKHHIYLTEDTYDGGFYRYLANTLNDSGFADLNEGQLQVAELKSGKNGERKVTWHTLSDPLAKTVPTRKQVSVMTRFKGGEGIVYANGFVYFTTKHDNRVWAFDTNTQVIDVLYDASDYDNPLLTGVDNITVDASGKLYVAEDGGDMQIVMLNQTGELQTLLQVVRQDSSEICGPAFSPDGSRLYFSSQRGQTGNSQGGLTYEISGFI